jgi:hypothetical protein
LPSSRLEDEVVVTRRGLREATKQKERAERCLVEMREAERALVLERDAAVARFETGGMDPKTLNKEQEAIDKSYRAERARSHVHILNPKP